MTVSSPAFPGATASPLRTRSWDPSWILWIAIIAVLLFLVVLPFVQLIATSFRSETGGGFTVENYASDYGRERYVQALFNSLQLGSGAAALAGVFAVPLAWAV